MLASLPDEVLCAIFTRVVPDAALARRLSAELNGEAPKAQNNNKRTIDLTAESQEDAAPPPHRHASRRS